MLPPISVATITNAIQPKIAVLRCAALHRPARAARLGDVMATFLEYGWGVYGGASHDHAVRKGGAAGVRSFGHRRLAGAASRTWRLPAAFLARDLRERFWRRVNVGDQVERAGQQLQTDQPRHLRDLLVAVPVRTEPVDVCVADLGRRGEHLLGEGDDRRRRRVARRALPRELD